MRLSPSLSGLNLGDKRGTTSSHVPPHDTGAVEVLLKSGLTSLCDRSLVQRETVRPRPGHAGVHSVCTVSKGTVGDKRFLTSTTPSEVPVKDLSGPCRDWLLRNKHRRGLRSWERTKFIVVFTNQFFLKYHYRDRLFFFF